MWFEGRWRASGWDLLGSRFQRRSLQQRRPRDTPLPPPWNLSFLFWWGHVLSVNWCVFFIFAFVSNNHLLPQEMMYVWNGFTIVGKRPELTEGILSTLEKAEEQLRNDPSKENFLISGFFFNTDTRLTVYCVMCRPIRVPHGRWVRCPAAEGSVLKKSGTAGPGWDLLQLCNLQVSLSWCHCNTPEAFEWESTKSSQQKLLLQQSLQ